MTEIKTYKCADCDFEDDFPLRAVAHFEEFPDHRAKDAPRGSIGNPGEVRVKRKRKFPFGKKKPKYVFIGLPEYDVTVKKGKKRKKKTHFAGPENE